jgi:RND superfamily putative drug exporter
VLATLSSVDWSWKSAIPALEHVAEKNSVSLIAADAPADRHEAHGQAIRRADSDSSAMIVIEGNSRLVKTPATPRLIQDLRRSAALSTCRISGVIG